MPKNLYLKNLPHESLRVKESKNEIGKKKISKIQNFNKIDAAKRKKTESLNRKILDLNFTSGIIDHEKYQELLYDHDFLQSENLSNHDYLITLEEFDQDVEDLEAYIEKAISLLFYFL